MRIVLNAQKAQTGQIKSVERAVPPPIGGWNARDPEAAMAETDALTLDNWYPLTGSVILRGGSVSHRTGFASRPQTLIPFHGRASAGKKLWAATDDGIFDATSSGAVGAAAVVLTNGQVQYTQYGTSAADFLYVVNGSDSAKLYSDGAWSSITDVSTPLALTGVPTTSLIGVHAHKRRLYFIERESLNFWFLAADAVGGALTSFDLGPLCRRGGYLVAMATWTIDGGSGPDDFAVFVTSEGEVIVFAGTDPGLVGFWSLVGVYFVARPLGRKPFIKYGGDLILLTELGAFQLSAALKNPGRLAITDKISRAFINAARLAKSVHGWEVVAYPLQNALLFNIPQSDGTFHQYVGNMLTKSWCRFTGWNTSTLAEFDGNLYYASATTVFRGWAGTSDNGTAITGEAVPAPNYMGTRGRKKRITLVRPLFRSVDTFTLEYSLQEDFAQRPVNGSTSFTLDGLAIWDTADWDAEDWPAEDAIYQGWITPSSYEGYAHSLRMKIASSTSAVEWLSTNFIVEYGTLM